VGLDRLPDHREKVAREDSLTDLAVELLVLVEGQQQAALRLDELTIDRFEEALQSDKLACGGPGERKPSNCALNGLAKQRASACGRGERATRGPRGGFSN
jgi:hypothetical protein